MPDPTPPPPCPRCGRPCPANEFAAYGRCEDCTTGRLPDLGGSPASPAVRGPVSLGGSAGKTRYRKGPPGRGAER